MKIENVLSLAEDKKYKGASDIEMLNVYDNKLPKDKKMPKLKKGVYGVDHGADGDAGVSEGLKENRYGFRILDVSSLNTDDPVEPETDSGEDIEGREDVDKKEDSRKKRERQRAASLTRYLQYVTASD